MSSNNLLLQTLIEPVAPEPILWLPQTLAWKLLFILLCVTLAFFLFKKAQLWHANQYRRDALKALHKIDNKSRLEALNELNQILKKVAVNAYGNQQVASLYGLEWIKFLQQQPGLYAQKYVTRKWQVALYNPDIASYVTSSEFDYLVSQSKSWIKQHSTIQKQGGEHA